MIIALICLITFSSTLAGGLFALRFKDKLHLILGFSAGAVVGVVFFDLFPEALALGGSQFGPDKITFVAALGFLIYMIFDRLAVLHTHEHGEQTSIKGKLGAGSLSLHSLLDGIAIGWAFQISTPIGMAIAIAVVAHDFSDGINTVSIILKDKNRGGDAFKWLLVDAIAPVLGILSTFVIKLPISRFAIVLALFSGFFLYIGASDLLPESQNQYPKIWTTLMTILGASVLYFVSKL
ncbi:MAG: ZIP family metal transporter [Bacteroidota bacterium]|nr:ZIP family metal transporter [Bacteroidota bacterium]